ncbi:MAG TPA: respiratory nitrate reductase subunit gamma [Candidatus Dormibacteraeota bacterium]|nr:respiratory nitrate reductase subunit gamma [Candidatus Dormibacteraeota bacterium]
MSGVLWIVVPYVAMTVFVVGHVWRYRVDQQSWGSRSTQIFERRLLRWGTLLFHLGAFAAIGGHVLGLLVPVRVTEAMGISEAAYHVISVTAGTLAGAAVVAGLAILLYRRTRVPRVRVTTTRIDVATYALLTLVIGLGMLETVGVNLLGGGYDYRSTVAIWFRGLFLLHPRPELMASVPLVYQVHALAAWLLFAFWPFSRLVHAWSLPAGYLVRPTILYRRRLPHPRRG